jgi:hypothetical protein
MDRRTGSRIFQWTAFLLKINKKGNNGTQVHCFEHKSDLGSHCCATLCSNNDPGVMRAACIVWKTRQIDRRTDMDGAMKCCSLTLARQQPADTHKTNVAERVFSSHASVRLQLPLRWGETVFIPQINTSEYGAAVEWYWQGKTEGLGEKPVPVPLCMTQIPHGLPLERTRAPEVRYQQLTAWATCARVPQWCLILVFFFWWGGGGGNVKLRHTAVWFSYVLFLKLLVGPRRKQLMPQFEFAHFAARAHVGGRK